MRDAETIEEELYIDSYAGVDVFFTQYQELRKNHPEYSDFRIIAKEQPYDEPPAAYLIYARPLTDAEIAKNKRRMEAHKSAEIEKAKQLLQENGIL